MRDNCFLYYLHVLLPTTLSNKCKVINETSARSLCRVLYLQLLRNCLELDVRCALVDGPYLAISPHLLRSILSREPYSSIPFNSEATNTASDLRSIQLCHRGVLYKVLASLLLSRRVVDKSSGSTYFRPGLRNLVLHTLKLTDEFSELLPVVPDVPTKILAPLPSVLEL